MTKTYNIIPEQTGETPDGGKVFRIRVEVLDENEVVVISGETSVVTDTPEEAYTYGETVYLPDLRNNLPRKLADMPLPTDVVPEPPPAEPDPTQGV